MGLDQSFQTVGEDLDQSHWYCSELVWAVYKNAGDIDLEYTPDIFGVIPKHHKMLTPRESQILKLLAEGNSAKQIALQLDLSVKTVEAIRRQVMEKIEVDNLVDLTKYAIREGLTVA